MRTALLSVLLVACAPPTELPLAAPSVSSSAAPTPSAPKILRREEAYARLGGAKLVVEIEGPRCRYGLEIPTAPGMVSVKSGVWLVFPSAACVATPDVSQTVGFTVFVPSGPWSSVEAASLESRVSWLGAPIEFLPPPESVALARRLLEAFALAHPELASATLRARSSLDLYDDRGAIVTDRARLLSLCAAGNGRACHASSSAAPQSERADLLARACQLEDDDACVALGQDLRQRAVDAVRRSREVQELRAFECGMGRRTHLVPLTPYDPQSCAPAPAIASGRR